ncbi:N-acetyltransferase domain-containing protein [Fusarium keratoplasticum]|uniref:N-acetyltransferase domain-containing protein n=1 Tax=Fusarium keratoplasticum TaxID=1328300 RepID=A0ACC0RC27_9HYPO|nr:N-acetyltransferase domain-containing protein [Fusarium keratoplasticum]KAI8680343.1 N-acetyltransferase domain-containing protein [Fusarium keratoplasticum]KAI8686413.1 N-acetyltransferase domain-containing protein [Fusarium keratoplasticum]
MTLRLRIATESDLDAVSDVATASFNPETDAISAHLFPPHLKPPGEAYAHAARPWRLARKTDRFRSQRTTLIVAVDEELSGKVVGFALWEKPVRGEEHGKPEAAPIKPPCATLDHAAFDEMKRVLGEDHAKRFGEKGSHNVWHLEMLGVDPSQQRRGIGKMLLQGAFEEADKFGEECYLVATPAGLPLYRGAGFEEVGVLKLFGVPHTSMIRKSQKIKPVDS